MDKRKTQTIGFYILLGLAFLVVTIIFWPFWELLAFSLILAMLFHPTYKRVEAAVSVPNLAAAFVVFLIAAIIAGPVLLIGQQVFNELAIVYHSLNLQNIASTSGNFVQQLPLPLQRLAISLQLDFQALLSRLTGQAFASLSALLSSLGWFFGSLVIVAFSVFFLLRDGDKIKKLVADLLPLSVANENILFEKLSVAVNGVVKGQFLVVLTISTVAFTGFSIFKIPNALLWSCLMFLAAFVPTFGTALVWTPAVLYLFLSGHIGAAVGLAVWACVSVILIDNVLSAKIVSSKVKLHPLLTLFGILGGVTTFGVLGVLLGPILIAIFVSLLEIYLTHLKKTQ